MWSFKLWRIRPCSVTSCWPICTDAIILHDPEVVWPVKWSALHRRYVCTSISFSLFLPRGRRVFHLIELRKRFRFNGLEYYYFLSEHGYYGKPDKRREKKEWQFCVAFMIFLYFHIGHRPVVNRPCGFVNNVKQWTIKKWKPSVKKNSPW